MKTTLLQRCSYVYLVTLFFWMLTGCGDTSKQIAKGKQQYSSNQLHLFQLIDDYNKNYYAASEANERENIRTIFQDRMKQFLVDSLGRYIDSMTVTVDTVMQKV